MESLPGLGKGAWRDNVFVERLWRSVKYEEVYSNVRSRQARCSLIDREAEGRDGPIEIKAKDVEQLTYKLRVIGGLLGTIWPIGWNFALMSKTSAIMA